MTVNEIKEIGFQFAAECKLSSAENNGFSIDIVPEFRNGSDKLVYAICVDDEVTYVGKTDRGLGRRFTAYRNDKEGTEGRIAAHMRFALTENSTVRIFVWIDKAPFELGSFRVDRFVAVEYALIDQVFLPWNKSKWT